MKSIIQSGVFKPNQTRFENRNETTTRAAREIIDSEATKRAAQMARLKALRLEREAESAAAAPPPEAAAPSARKRVVRKR
jgi:hypothetical protein